MRQSTVLVVDDEKEIADFIELYLKNENYNVFKFYNGKANKLHEPCSKK